SVPKGPAPRPRRSICVPIIWAPACSAMPPAGSGNIWAGARCWRCWRHCSAAQVGWCGVSSAPSVNALFTTVAQRALAAPTVIAGTTGDQAVALGREGEVLLRAGAVVNEARNRAALYRVAVAAQGLQGEHLAHDRLPL